MMFHVRLKHLINLVVVLAGLAVAGLTARHFAHTGWPIHHANPWLVALAARDRARRLRAQGLGLAAALPRRRAPDDAHPRGRGRRRIGRRDRAARALRRGDPRRGRQAASAVAAPVSARSPLALRARARRQRRADAARVGLARGPQRVVAHPRRADRRGRGRRRRSRRRSRPSAAVTRSLVRALPPRRLDGGPLDAFAGAPSPPGRRSRSRGRSARSRSSCCSRRSG